MKVFLTVIIFSIVLFLYIHMHFHLNTSDDLEVYTIENVSKDRLEEICNLKQPVLFDYKNENLLDTVNIGKMEEMYGAFDVNFRNITDKDKESEIYLPIYWSLPHNLKSPSFILNCFEIIDLHSEIIYIKNSPCLVYGDFLMHALMSVAAGLKWNRGNSGQAGVKVVWQTN